MKEDNMAMIVWDYSINFIFQNQEFIRSIFTCDTVPHVTMHFSRLSSSILCNNAATSCLDGCLLL